MTEYVNLCATCAAVIDEEWQLLNTRTRNRYCSGECWSEGVDA